ncbi:MAG: GPO family capsid scaffolding protein [Gammaproteobacteria bacterium]|nr:GPO family capsid scaffolding protein [Gammaproteobacteria bacterium]
MATQLKTGWLCIATSGATVDDSGRIIEKEWLNDMAQHYSAKLYTAKIWPDHSRWYSAGKVLALKVEKATEPGLEDEVQLFAILAPSDTLINANRQGQYSYSSIEVIKNFRNKDHFYLGGLGATDSPASAGTDEMRFSGIKSNDFGDSASIGYFDGHKFDLTQCIEEEKEGFLNKYFNRKKSTNEPEDETMKPEEITALALAFSQALEPQFTALQTAIAGNEGGSVDDDTPPESEENKQYKVLEDSHKTLQENFTALNDKFEALQKNPAGDETPPGDGRGGDAEHPEVI